MAGRGPFAYLVKAATIPYPQASLRIGDRHPLGLGAGGLAILAALPKDEAETVLTINAPAIAERYTHMTLDTVRRMLHETREQGYSFIPGILAPGYWGIGVPVLRTRRTTRRGCRPDCRCEPTERRPTGCDCRR